MKRMSHESSMKLYVNQPIWLDISLDGVHVRRGTDGLFLNVPPNKDVVWLNDADLTWTTERVSLVYPGLGMDTLMNDLNARAASRAAWFFALERVWCSTSAALVEDCGRRRRLFYA